jgi:rod shape-determining protein MreD
MTIYIVVPLLVLVAILQATIVPHITFWGVFPDLPVVVVACWGMLRGAREGLIWGFVAGVAVDLLSGAPFGAATLGLMLAGTLSGLGAAAVSRAFALLPMMTTFLVTIVYDVVFLAIIQGTGGHVPWPDMLLQIVLLSAVLNAVLTPVFLWLVSQLNAAMRQKEMKW